MGIMTWFASRHYKKELVELLEYLDSKTNEDVAALLLSVFLIRNIRLFPTDSQYDNLKSKGIPDALIEEEAIYIRNYKKGNEVRLLELLDATDNKMLKLAFRVHLYSNLALSYEGYNESLKKLWSRLFDGIPHLRDVYTGDPHGERHKLVEEFFSAPKSIMPSHI